MTTKEPGRREKFFVSNAIKLGISYVLAIGLIIGLYKLLPLSPILLTPNIVVSDWPRQPTSCWDLVLLNEEGAFCTLKRKKRNIILMGDSHAQQLVFGFERAQTSLENFKSSNLIFLTSKLMTGSWRSPAFNELHQIKYVHSLLSKMSREDVVVFAVASGHLEDSVLGSLVDEKRLQNDLSKMLRNLFLEENLKGKLILMLDTPHLENNVARLCYGRKNANRSLCYLDHALYQKQNMRLLASYTDFINGLDETSSNVEIVNPKGVFCEENNCSLFDESGFMLIDGNHIKASVSEKVVKRHLLDVL